MPTSSLTRRPRPIAAPPPSTALPRALHEGLSLSHLPGLDGLRAVAVLLVVFYHFGFAAVPGGHGVLMFFVLSGFLITWLLLGERERTGRIRLGLFYGRRALRIFPAFYCFWLLWTAATVITHKPIVWGQALASLGYVNNYYQAILGDPNTGYSHTWSLAVEEQFYLLWPVALLALGRNPRRIAIALAAVIGAVWIHRAILAFVVGANQGYFFEAFDTRADHLAVGCLLAVLLKEGYLARLWAWLCTPLLSLAALALLVASVALSQVLGTTYRNVVGFAIDPLLIAALIAQVIALRESPLWRWLGWRWVRYLGALSYSIYLYQQVVIHPTRERVASFSVPVQLAATLAAVLLAAAASYHLVERPFLRLKRRIEA